MRKTLMLKKSRLDQIRLILEIRLKKVFTIGNHL